MAYIAQKKKVDYYRQTLNLYLEIKHIATENTEFFDTLKK